MAVTTLSLEYFFVFFRDWFETAFCFSQNNYPIYILSVENKSVQFHRLDVFGKKGRQWLGKKEDLERSLPTYLKEQKKE